MFIYDKFPCRIALMQTNFLMNVIIVYENLDFSCFKIAKKCVSIDVKFLEYQFQNFQLLS